MAKTFFNMWYEKSSQKKKLFQKKYGRKPNKEEIKMLRKNLIDLGTVYTVESNQKNVNEIIRVKNSGGDVASHDV